MSDEVRSLLGELKRAGRPLAHVIAELPTSEFDARFGNFVISPDAYVEAVYRGV